MNSFRTHKQKDKNRYTYPSKGSINIGRDPSTGKDIFIYIYVSKYPYFSWSFALGILSGKEFGKKWKEFGRRLFSVRKEIGFLTAWKEFQERKIMGKTTI